MQQAQFQDDPYTAIVEMMGNGAHGPRYCVGTVTCAAPITVLVDGIPLTGQDLYVNRELLAHKEQITITLGSTTSGTIQYPGRLAVGDTVALLTQDDQTYILLCKVVRMA